MAAKRALITGLKGFTGKYIAEELVSAGYEVFGCGKDVEDSADSHFKSVDLCNKQEVSDYVALVNPQVVVHLAAISYVAHNDVDEMYRVNIVGSRNLLSALVEENIRPEIVLLASSANIYGNATVEGLIDESVKLSPANDYATTKLAMEYMAYQWFDRLPIVITRPFNYTGVGQTPRFLLPKIVSHFSEQKPVIELGNMDVVREFSDVRTVAAVYRQLIDKKPAGEIYNVCSGVGYSLSDILLMMSEIAGYDIDAVVNPDFVRANEIKSLVGSNEKLKTLIGDVNAIPLKETLSWMYQDLMSKEQ